MTKKMEFLSKTAFEKKRFKQRVQFPDKYPMASYARRMPGVRNFPLFSWTDNRTNHDHRLSRWFDEAP